MVIYVVYALLMAVNVPGMTLGYWWSIASFSFIGGLVVSQAIRDIVSYR